jgi:amino acid transporter
MDEPDDSTRTPRFIGASILGAVIGAIVGAVVAVNIAIFVGPDQGYESSIGDLFDANPFVAVLTVFVLAVGPVVGIVVARKTANRRYSELP